MFAHPVRRAAVVAVVLLSGLFLAGCFTTALSLGTDADAKVDPAYCGDWAMTWTDAEGQNKSASLVIRRFDQKHYYVEWDAPGQKPVRMSGFLVPVKSATFAQLTALGDRGENDNTHLIARIEVSGTTLTLKHLDEDFFADVKTDEQLRAKVEQNLDNPAMYAEKMTGGLVSQP
jgi:hypothetical protein